MPGRAVVAALLAVAAGCITAAPATARSAEPFRFPYHCERDPGVGTTCSESHGVFVTNDNGIASVLIDNGRGSASFIGEGDLAGCSQIIESRDHTVQVLRGGSTQVQMVRNESR